jgi:hypothetical protein
MIIVGWMVIASAFIETDREADAWVAFYECAETHLESVATVVESLNEGATLITLSLCSPTAVELMNVMARDREVFCGGQADCANYTAYAQSAQAVIERETRLRIYHARRGGYE